MSTRKAYILLWSVIPFLLIASGIAPNSAFDIQMHDTYFVIAGFHISFSLALIFFILGLGYWSCKNRPLNKWLTLIHVLLTLLLPLIIGVLLKENTLMQSLGYYTNPPSAKASRLIQINLIIFSTLVLWGSVQLLFILNLIWGFRK